MLTAAERESSLEAVGAFITAVHAHIEARENSHDDSEGQDPRVKEFLEKHFGPGYERLPRAAYATDRGATGNVSTGRAAGAFDSGDKLIVFASDDIAKDLPADLRKLFMALSEEERVFLLTMDKKYRTPYTNMSQEEQGFFRSIGTSERNAYIAMSPEERIFFRELDAQHRPLYLVLGGGHRTLLRQRTDLEAYLARLKEEIGQNAEKPSMDLARELSTELVGKQGASDVRQAAQRVLVNFFNEYPGDKRTAILGSLQSLIGSNQGYLDTLLREVAERLSKAQSEPAPVNADYTGHFMKARHWLQALAQQLLHVDVNREELIAGLVEAVVASAQFTATYLPQKKAALGDQNLLLRRPIMG